MAHAPHVPVLALLAICRLWFGAGQERCALATAHYDDALYMRLAGNIANGDWLGAYDRLTLVKGPGYALWIAANHLLGLPLLVADGALYVLASVVLTRAFRPLVASTVARSLLFVLLLFNPLAFGGDALRFNRDSTYASLTMLVVGCAIGLATRSQASRSIVLRWSLGLGGALGCLWLVHEESSWILPAVVLAYALLAFEIWRASGRGAALGVASLLLPLVLGFAPSVWVSDENGSRYGLAVVSEFQSAEFGAANGALSRVTHATERRYDLVPREVRERLYPHSPALRELRPFLDGPNGAAWSRISHNQLGLPLTESRGEILGNWFAWALRDAVFFSGHNDSAPDAALFYSQLAQEIDAACDSGAVAAGPPRHTVVPRFRTSDVVPMLMSFGTNLQRLALLQDFERRCRTSGNATQLARFAALSGDRLAPGAAAVSDASSWRVTILDGLATIYRRIVGPLLLLALPLCFLVAWRRSLRLPLASIAVACVLLAAVGARVSILSYIDVTFFHVKLRLLSPVYPLALAFLWFGVSATWSAGAASRREAATERGADEPDAAVG